MKKEKADPPIHTPPTPINDIPTKPIPAIQRYTIDLRTLTKEEEETLLKVLERDYLEMEILDNKLGAIRKDIQDIRMKGALSKGDNLNTICARCKHKFWLLPMPFTDKGARCNKCKFRVCARCRLKQLNGTWVCSLCFRYRQEKIMSGEWMTKSCGLYGSDLLRASLRDRGRVVEDHYTDLPGTNGNTQYIHKAALTKDDDDDSGSRTSINSTSFARTLDDKDENSDSSNNRRDGNNSYDDGSSGSSNGGDDLDVNLDTGSCKNVVAATARATGRSATEATELADGKVGGHSVTGSNNTNFARLPPAKQSKHSKEPLETLNKSKSGGTMVGIRKSINMLGDLKKKKKKKKKKKESKGIRNLLEKHIQGDQEKGKKKKKKKAVEEETNETPAPEEKKKSQKVKKPNDENQSWRKSGIEEDCNRAMNEDLSGDESGGRQRSVDLNNVNLRSIPSEFLESADRKPTSRPRESKASRRKDASDVTDKTGKRPPRFEGNIFVCSEYKRKNDLVCSPVTGAKTVTDKCSEHLEGKHSEFAIDNGKVLRGRNCSEFENGNDITTSPSQGLVKFMSCIRKRITRTKMDTHTNKVRLKEILGDDMELQKTKRDEFSSREVQRGIKGQKNKAAIKVTSPSFSRAKYLDAIDQSKLVIDSSRSRSKHSKRYGDTVKSKVKKKKSLGELIEVGNDGGVSSSETAPLRPCQLSDSGTRLTQIHTHPLIQSSPCDYSKKGKESRYEKAKAGHKRPKADGASGDWKGYQQPWEISEANFNVNFQPSRTTVRKDGRKMSRPAPRRASQHRTNFASPAAPGDSATNYEPWAVPSDVKKDKDGSQSIRSPQNSGSVLKKGNKRISNERKEKTSELEAFRSKARTTSGSISPRIVSSSLENSESEFGSLATTSPNDSFSSHPIEDERSQEEEERKFVLHWHETLRRKSVDEKMQQRRRQSFGYLEKPLMSCSKEPLFREIVSLVIPEKPLNPNQMSQISPAPSIDSTSSQDSISSYIRHFMDKSRSSRKMTSTPSLSPEVTTRSEKRRQIEATPSDSPKVSYKSVAWIPTGTRDKLKRAESDRIPSQPPISVTRERKCKRKSVEATEDNTSSPSTQEDPEGRNTNASGQRRDSYSKALENQKIRVILPPGNDNVDSPDAEHLSGSTSSLHDGKPIVDESDKDSVKSSLSSHYSPLPISKNASTNSSFSSRSSKSMPSDSMARDHENDRNNGQHISDPNAEDFTNNIGGRASNDEIPGLSGPRGKASAVPGRDSSPGRKESFEEIYDSNVNRLVKMMTGGDALSDTDSSDARSPRLLPRPPDSGKDSECLLQKRLSLSEELETNIKYLEEEDNKKEDSDAHDMHGDDDLVDNIDDDLNNVEDNRVDKTAEDRVQSDELLDDYSGSFFSSTADEEEVSSGSEEVPYMQEAPDSDESYLSLLKYKQGLISDQHTGSVDDETTQGRSSPQNEFETLDDQNLLLAYLRTPENDVPYEFRLSLCRNNSTASDALSRITEISEPYGEAESPNSGDSTDSDDTLHDGNFEQSFSDDNEAEDNSKGSVINIYEVGNNKDPKSETGSGSDNEGKILKHENKQDEPYYAKDESTPVPGEKNPEDASSEDLIQGFEETLKGDVSLSSSILSEFDLDKEPEDIQDLARTNQMAPSISLSEASAKSSSESNAGSDQMGTGKVTLLSMALEQRHKDKQEHPPLRQLKIYKMLSSSISDSSLDEEEEEEEVRREKRQENAPYEPVRQPRNPVIKIESMGNDQDSVRDSDSGVNSSQTSRANTPDQRSLNSDKGPNHNSNALTLRPQVPSISVTEEAKEEDDDLDELFQKHRPIGGSNLSARSSLRDSRESLYSVYSAAGEENYGNIPVTGEINFHLDYNYKANILEIHIKQCKDLAPVDVKRNRSDPYVKTYLLPDKTRNGKRKTKIKRHSLNPTFDEVLQYPISKTELESRSLWIAVWNNDRFGRNDFLGEVTIPLDYYEFDKSAPKWYALQDRIPDEAPAMTYKGDLFISMKYVPASMVGSPTKKRGSLRRSKDKGLKTGFGEVHVVVKEAQNLTAMRSSAGSNPFCKGYLLPDQSHSSKQKTPVIKKTTNPHWEHLLIFEGVDETQLENHGLELTIWDHEKLSSNDFLGGVRLNLGTGFIKGKPTDWMDARGEEIEVWQSIIDTPNEWMDAQLPLRASMGKENIKK